MKCHNFLQVADTVAEDTIMNVLLCVTHKLCFAVNQFISPVKYSC